MLHSKEQIEQALKLHKLINKSSTLGSGKKAPLPKKALVKRPKKGSGDVTTSKTMDQSSKERKASPEKTLASPKVEKCEEHPGESLQFYSLSYNKALCPTCLLSGVYAGTETLSIKKASETLKHKMADLVIEMEGKLDGYELLMKKLANRKEELKDITTGHKKEIAANITQLINKLQNKQKELVAELEQIEKEKLEDLNIASQRIKSHEDQVRTKKVELENKVRDLNGLSLCNFYSKQAYAIQNCLQDEGSLHLQEARIISETNINLQGRVCLDRFKEAIRFSNAEIERVSIYALEPLIEQAKSSTRARSPVKEHISDKELAYSHRKTRELVGSGYTGSPGRHGGLASGSKGTTVGISSRGYSGARSNLNLRERKQDIDDILNSGYQRIQEMKAMSSMYSMPLTSKSKKREDIFGLSDLLSSSTSKRPISTKGTHHPGYSNSETKFQTLFSEPRMSGKENTQFSHKGTPHRGIDVDRYSINAKML